MGVFFISLWVFFTLLLLRSLSPPLLACRVVFTVSASGHTRST
jgi:hypothetical protein